ncbi:MAG: hypothetical protein KDJ65_26485 [Anaerolineae bacterium]|nr:hypothetical protein [Anaerolineae bacterium]MCP5127499.1 hypothetical protein [Gammaproteobacteria bacterium]
MTITKKPRLVEKGNLPEAEIAALIDKGGSVARQGGKKSAQNKQQFIQLRLNPDFLAQIDEALKKRKVKIPRHTWILEALCEKLEREGGEVG